MSVLEVTIFIRYIIEEKIIKQEFIFKTKKKNFRYLTNNKFLMNERLINTIKKKYILDLDFLGLVFEKDRVIITYKKEKDIELFSDYFIIRGLIPDNTGCNFCKYKIEKNDYLVCSFQNNKVYTKSLQQCKFFRQKEL